MEFLMTILLCKAKLAKKSWIYKMKEKTIIVALK